MLPQDVQVLDVPFVSRTCVVDNMKSLNGWDVTVTKRSVGTRAEAEASEQNLHSLSN